MKLLFPAVFFAALVATASAGGKSSKSYSKGHKPSKSAKGPKCPKGSKGFGEKCGYYKDDVCCNKHDPEDPNIVCEDLGDIFGKRCTDCLPTDEPCINDRDCCNPGICFQGFCTEQCLEYHQPCEIDGLGTEACCEGLSCCELTNKCVAPPCNDLGEDCCLNEDCCDNEIVFCNPSGTCEAPPPPVLVRDDIISIGPEDHCFIEGNCIKSHEGFGSSNYNNTVNCRVNVTSGAGLLEILSFRTESCCDRVIISDDNDMELFRLAGSKPSGQVAGAIGAGILPGYSFQFIADGGVTFAGFELCLTNPSLEI